MSGAGAQPSPRAADAGGDDLVTIRITGLSLEAFRLSSEHHDELFREFALIQSREPIAGHTVPSRLLSLMTELTGQYSGFSALPQAELDAALARGDPTVDLVYELPRAVKEACLHLAELLHEADEYCRQGDLLTMAPPTALAFRDWFLLEFVRQIDGRPPRTWAEFIAPD